MNTVIALLELLTALLENLDHSCPTAGGTCAPIWIYYCWIPCYLDLGGSIRGTKDTINYGCQKFSIKCKFRETTFKMVEKYAYIRVNITKTIPL